jgi:hypothetical protein
VARLVFVVSRTQPERYAFLTRAFDGEEAVEIVLDRRHGERRRQPVACAHERRRRDRRARVQTGELDRLGWTLIRR